MSDAIHDIAVVNKYFKDLNYPAKPLSEEAKTYLSKFFQVDGFIRLCDRIFGKYFWKTSNERNDCWMDAANRNPKGKVAAELFKLISPGSHFFNFLEAVSSPEPSFSNNLKFLWKTEETEGESVILDVVDFPLAMLYQDSTRFLMESENTNLYDLPKSVCPSFLFIPFWAPPLVTRKEQSQQRVFTSLRCKPLAYYFIRLMFYLFSHAECLGEQFFGEKEFSGNKLFKLIKEAVQYDTQLKSFPFYYNIGSVYIQYYVRSTFASQISSAKLLEDVVWTSKDMSAAMLLCFSYFVDARCMPEIDQECLRGKRVDDVRLANIFGTLPMLAELYLALHRDWEFVGSSFNQNKADFLTSTVRSSWNDIANVRNSLFRNCLVCIRQVLISLDGSLKWKLDAICSLLHLWKVLLLPPIKSENMREYVITHLEAYIFIFVDVLDCLPKSNFFFSLTQSAASCLREVLDIFNDTVIFSLLDEIKMNSSLKDISRQNFVLNWKREDGLTELPNLYEKDSLRAVTRTRMAIKEKMTQKGCSRSVKEELERCLNSISKIFPNFEESNDIVSELLGESAKDRKAVAGNPQLSHTILKNELNSYIDSNSKKSGFQHWVFHDICRKEIPFFVSVSKVLDCFIISIQETLYSSLIPKCPNYHNLWLCGDQNEKCSYHCRNTAIWRCELCQVSFCADCKPLPLTAKGRKMLERNHGDFSSTCSVCNRFLSGDCVSYVNAEKQDFFCHICASRPYLSLSTRWFASYQAITLLCIVFMFLLLWW